MDESGQKMAYYARKQEGEQSDNQSQSVSLSRPPARYLREQPGEASAAQICIA